MSYKDPQAEKQTSQKPEFIRHAIATLERQQGMTYKFSIFRPLQNRKLSFLAPPILFVMPPFKRHALFICHAPFIRHAPVCTSCPLLYVMSPTKEPEHTQQGHDLYIEACESPHAAMFERKLKQKTVIARLPNTEPSNATWTT